MSEMTAKEYAKQVNRMCDIYCDDDCENCPLFDESVACHDFLFVNSDRAEEIVGLWAEMHPERTYRQDLIESYPEAKIYALQVCDIYGINACKFPNDTVCTRCPMWDEPMTEVQDEQR